MRDYRVYSLDEYRKLLFSVTEEDLPFRVHLPGPLEVNTAEDIPRVEAAMEFLKWYDKHHP